MSGSDHAHGHADLGGRHGAAVVPGERPVEFWERRYGGEDRVWSGRVNRVLADVVAGLAPGRSLDLGCGEGGDVLWLAERGWLATGIDLSLTAVTRARELAVRREVSRARFIVADLSEWARGSESPDEPGRAQGAAGAFDLVTASFLQSPVALARDVILRAAAERVAPGGSLVVVSHAAPPLGSMLGDHPSNFPTPESELALLGLDPLCWEVLVAEVREREGTGPHGGQMRLGDTVIVARRCDETS